MSAPLSGTRVIEVAMFAPDGVGMHLADLGAEVIKVEAPGLGDPARLLGRAIDGEAPATRRWNRGKHSLALDLRRPEGQRVFRELVREADAVVEGMRAGALERLGLGYDDLLAVNPRLVFVSVSGWGDSGPYRELASHGLAFDAYAGLAPPRADAERPTRPAGHVWQALEAAPLYAALALVSGILQARTSGVPTRIEVSQADAGAVWNGWRIAYEAAHAEPEASEEAERAAQHERREALAAAAEIETHEADPERREGPLHDVRYQYYAASDGLVLLMATESRFWRNFCEAIERRDLFERWPGEGYADHDYGNDALRDELCAIFAERSQAEWVELFVSHDVAGAPVHAPGETHRDPHFRARGLWTEIEQHGMRTPGSPVRIDGQPAVASRPAPRAGADGQAVLSRVLGYDAEQIEALRAAGTFGARRDPGAATETDKEGDTGGRRSMDRSRRTDGGPKP